MRDLALTRHAQFGGAVDVAAGVAANHGRLDQPRTGRPTISDARGVLYLLPSCKPMQVGARR